LAISSTLESEWLPGSHQIEAVLEFLEGQAYGVRGLIALLGTVTPVDAAFLLSLQTLPSLTTTRKGVSLVDMPLVWLERSFSLAAL
jgi:hypothetical protein